MWLVAKRQITILGLGRQLQIGFARSSQRRGKSPETGQSEFIDVRHRRQAVEKTVDGPLRALDVEYPATACATLPPFEAAPDS